MKHTELVTTCPLCGKNKQTHWTFASDILHEVCPGKFEYVKCCNCGLIYLKNRIPETKISKIYPDTYDPYQNQSADNEEHAIPPYSLVQKLLGNKALTKIQKKIGKTLAQLFPEQLSNELNRIYTPTKTNSKLLDFGCGSTAFLNIARNKNWCTLGADFNSTAIKSVVENGHDGLLLNSMVDLDEIKDGSIDLIRLNHVIEHLYDPLATILILKRKLKPLGTIHISTPNGSGYSAKSFRRNWRGLECPRHVCLFSPQAMTHFLKSSGLYHFKIFHEDNPKDLIRSIGFKQAKKYGANAQQIEQLFKNRKLFEKYYFHSKIAALLRKGDRIHVIATIQN